MKRIIAAVALTTVAAAPGLAAVSESETSTVGVGVLPVLVIVDPGNGDETPPVELVEFSGPFVEQLPTDAGGEYIVTNATIDWTLLGFGVTNPMRSMVHVGNSDDPSGVPQIFPDPDSQEIWTAFQLDQDDWETFEPELFLGEPLSLAQIFGPWSFGNDIVNWYQIEDASGLAPLSIARGFFFEAQPWSESFGVGVNGNFEPGFFRGGGVAVIPLPATLPLLLGGLGLLGLAARRRRAG